MIGSTGRVMTGGLVVGGAVVAGACVVGGAVTGGAVVGGAVTGGFVVGGAVVAGGFVVGGAVVAGGLVVGGAVVAGGWVVGGSVVEAGFVVDVGFVVGAGPLLLLGGLGAASATGTGVGAVPSTAARTFVLLWRAPVAEGFGAAVEPCVAPSGARGEDGVVATDPPAPRVVDVAASSSFTGSFDAARCDTNVGTSGCRVASAMSTAPTTKMQQNAIVTILRSVMWMPFPRAASQTLSVGTTSHGMGRG